MTENTEAETAESPPNNGPPVQTGKRSRRKRLSVWFRGIFNKKPAYRITKHGIEKRYFNFADTETLPFDTETYKDTQIFLGSYANPWYFNLDEIEKAYPNFAEQEITEISDVFNEKHVYPSQRWKLLANQNALRDMFVGGAIDEQRIMRLLYAAIGGIGFVLILLLFGGP